MRSVELPRIERPEFVDRELVSWQQIATRLSTESSRRERLLRRSLSLVDAGALAIALLTAHLLASTVSLRWPVMLLVPTIVAAAKVLGLYESDDQRIRKTTIEELPRIAQLGAMVVVGVWLGDSVLLSGPADKAQTVLLGLTFVVAAALGRRAVRKLAGSRLPHERCLFVGDEDSYVRLGAVFERHGLPAELVARVAIEDVVSHSSSDLPADAPALLRIVAATEAHRLIIGPHRHTNAMTFELVEAARAVGARVSLLPDMLEVVGSSVDFDDLYGVTLLGVRRTQLSRSSKRLKRAFDLTGAIALLIAAAPIMAVIAVTIRLDSPGPWLFAQWRIGRDGERFRIFKFRTMVDGADALKDELRHRNESYGLFKISNDPRITRVGRILRRTSLDELPQIFNVLLGQMSLVGPRPLVADEDERILGTQRERLRLTPGMTGQWQIAGSARVPLEDMVKLDYLYVSNWTLWGDVKILLRTVPYVVSQRGQ